MFEGLRAGMLARLSRWRWLRPGQVYAVPEVTGGYSLWCVKHRDATGISLQLLTLLPELPTSLDDTDLLERSAARPSFQLLEKREFRALQPRYLGCVRAKTSEAPRA